MKFPTFRRISVPLLVLTMLVGPASIDFPLAAGATIQPSAVVIVDGVRVTASPGLVLKQGVVDTARGLCLGVDHRIEIFAPKSIAYVSVGVGVTETCALVIQEVEFKTEHVLPDGTVLRAAAKPTLRELLAPKSLAYADTQHQIWGRHLMHEQFHVTTTLVYREFTYWEGPTSVYSPATTAAYCWRAGTGWTILSCYGGNELTGPSQVQEYTAGDFENQFGSLRHHLGAHPNAWIGGNSVFCDGVGATMPFAWHDHCEFARVF